MSQQLPYRLEMENRRVIVSLQPELNEVPWSDIEKVGSEILEKLQNISNPNLLVDLCPLSYMGSAQVALVVRMFKSVKEKNGKMIVANQNPMVLEVLTLAGLNKVWTIVESRERGLAMLGGGGRSSSSAADLEEENALPGVVALIAVFVAALFLVVHLANPTLIPARGGLMGSLACGGVAFLAGLWAINSGNRSMGVGVLVVSMGVLLFGVFKLAEPASAAPPAGAAAETSDKTDPAAAPASTDAPKVDEKPAGEK
ncbi:MAG: STAS domain-containing protein [Planctomycetaceae bacterium]